MKHHKPKPKYVVFITDKVENDVEEWHCNSSQVEGNKNSNLW
jgi:hypothetical protein